MICSDLMDGPSAATIAVIIGVILLTLQRGVIQLRLTVLHTTHSTTHQYRAVVGKTNYSTGGLTRRNGFAKLSMNVLGTRLFLSWTSYKRRT